MIGARALSMEEILEELINKARRVTEEELRKLVVYLHGQAGIAGLPFPHCLLLY